MMNGGHKKETVPDREVKAASTTTSQQQQSSTWYTLDRQQKDQAAAAEAASAPVGSPSAAGTSRQPQSQPPISPLSPASSSLPAAAAALPKLPRQSAVDRKVSWGDQSVEDNYKNNDDGGMKIIEDSKMEQKAETHTQGESTMNKILGNNVDDGRVTSQAATTTATTSRHSRKISWGGTTIEIPNIFESHLSLDNDDYAPLVDFNGSNTPFYGAGVGGDPSLGLPTSSLSQPNIPLQSHDEIPQPSPIEPATLYHGSDYTKLELEHGERRRLAAMAVEAAENALHSFTPSSYPRSNVVSAADLAKVHPFESRAEGQLLRSLEASSTTAAAAATSDRTQNSNGDSENGGGSNDDESDDVEAVASLFTPVGETLLGNVPEGSEAIFHRQSQSSTSASGPPSNTSVNSSGDDDGGGNSSSTVGPNSHQQQSSSASAIDGPPPGSSSVGSGSFGTGSRGKELFSPNRRARRTRGASNVAGGHNQIPIPKTTHRRQKTLEETLATFNQTMETENTAGATNFHDVNSYDNNKAGHRRRTTSSDLFNDNMARLFGSEHDFSSSKNLEPHPMELLPLNENPIDEVIAPDSNDMNRPRVESDLDSFAYTASAIDEENPSNEKVRQGSDANDKHRDNFMDAGVNNSYPMDAANIDSGGNSSLKRKPSVFVRFCQKIGLMQNLDEFLNPWKPSMRKYVQSYFWLLVVSIGIAAVLFYLFGNPPTGIVDLESSKAFNGTKYVSVEGKTIDPYARASYSWWALFAFARLPVTFALAKTIELVLIDFMILDRRWVASCIGPTLTLLIVQSKGWPSTLFFWSICNLCLLYGDSRFVAHWGYWQDYVGLFNESNPSGAIPSNDMNLRIQLIALVVSLCVAIKRLLIGYQQGRNIYLYYVEDLTKIVTKILLISEVAILAARLEREIIHHGEASQGGENIVAKRASSSGIDVATKRMTDNMENDDSSFQEEDDDKASATGGSEPTDRSYSDPSSRKKLLISDQEKNYATGRLTRSQKRRIERLLGNWDEPENEASLKESVSIGAILQFRTSLRKLDSPFPFSYSFGRAESRDRCIQASQDLYLRLLNYSLDPTLHLNILGLVALERDGSLNVEKLRSLMKVFRPGRDGRLSLIDFVKSVDVVYKEMKMLRASVRSSQKIDHASERIFNVVFYAAIGCLVLYALGFDPLAIFVSLSTIVLAFSFMISRASSNYFEGLLFILYRRPYDIGDRIVVQPVDAATSDNGSTHWIVRDIDLFTTTCIYAYTNEVATLNNGSIANCRILNGARSLPSLNYVTLRFGIDVTFDQIEIFREGLALYVEQRPREWSKLWAVRAMQVQSDQGFVEYSVILEHVDNWQNLDGILYSRGQVRSFCHELAKQLQMRYVSPSLPVNLTIHGGSGVGNEGDFVAGILSDRPDHCVGNNERSNSNRVSKRDESISDIVNHLNRYESIGGRR
mmetsp:Transcript_17151/g.41621  ORF Transcript_17151/g.41621 Transcript_17151/m.41621 type:complete len:1437 (-) Transcript_17151:162-4472(-)